MSRLLVESSMLSGLKFAGATDTAKLLHVLALCYAAENLTDGFITEPAARKLTTARSRDFDRAIDHLTTVQPGCTSPSWEQRFPDQGEPNRNQGEPNRVWFLHDYDDPLYDNPMKGDLDKRRVQKAQAGHEGGKKSADARREKYGTAQPVRSTPEAEAEADATKHPEAGGSGGASAQKAAKRPPAPEAASKLARAGAHAQPFPSSPDPSVTPDTSGVKETSDEHGDDAVLVGNGAAPTSREPSVLVQVQHLKGWLYAKRGWTDPKRETHLHEEAQAKLIVELGLPMAHVISRLNAMWDETDPDDRPSSLEYFWTRLQDEQHAMVKQPRSHVHADTGPSKIDTSTAATRTIR